MAPPGVSNWKRPYTSIYNDNYKYGTGLYSDTLGDIEKRYSESLGKTQLRSDRPDLAFTTFAGSNLASSPTPGGDSSSRMTPMTPTTPVMPLFESRLSSALHSSYALDDQVQEAISSRAEQRRQKAEANERRQKAEADDFFASVEGGSRPRPKSCLYDEWSLPRPKAAEEELFPEISKRKATSNGPSASGWREKSRLLQDQLESLETNMSSVGSKLQGELSSLKSKYQGEISDLTRTVETTSQQASDLHKLCKRQQNQLLELQSAYEDSQRNVSDALEEVSLWQNKCRCIKKEMDRLREEVEMAVQKNSRA